MTILSLIEKQAGVEMCQSQAQLGYPVEAELKLIIKFQVWALIEYTCKCYKIRFADFVIFNLFSIELRLCGDVGEKEN